MSFFCCILAFHQVSSLLSLTLRFMPSCVFVRNSVEGHRHAPGECRVCVVVGRHQLARWRVLAAGDGHCAQELAVAPRAVSATRMCFFGAAVCQVYFSYVSEIWLSQSILAYFRSVVCAFLLTPCAWLLAHFHSSRSFVRVFLLRAPQLRPDHGSLRVLGHAGGADSVPVHAVRRHLLPQGETWQSGACETLY